MEFYRWILILTGVVLLGIAFMMGRKNKQTSVYHRKVPDAYDPSLDELSVPITDSVAEVPQESNEPLNYAADADSFLTDDEVDAAIPATDDYDLEPVQAEAAQAESGHADIAQAGDEIRYDVDDIDLDAPVESVSFDVSGDAEPEQEEHAGSGKVTSFASAVKLANRSDDSQNKFSEEFDLYPEPVQLENFEEKLVTVHVAASNDRRFYGNDLKAVFERHGYKFGRMSLYHCTLEGDKVFSIANMVKPGTFDQENMASFETPGITLFMRLPIELDADVAFDFLIREAQELAEELNGQLRDGDRNPLSQQTIQHMREDIQQYVFRTRRVLHS